QDWAKRLADVNVSKDDLNLLVANYLFTEGYLSAAENFSREAGLSSSSLSSSGSTDGAGAALGDVDSIRSRMEIRRAVLRGQVESALDQVVDLDLEILDLDPSLHFHLLQQHLIELIRAGEVGHALAFAQHELAPLAEEHPRFLKELERTMALLAFELPVLAALPPMPPHISSLLDPSQRLRTARELNAAILHAQGHPAESKLPQLLGVMTWGEGLLNEK
ncbi:lish motif-containing protein, partial [Rhodotorula diobovata]